MTEVRERSLAWLSLFTSLGTLLCCALPALLVALGMGAVVAGLASDVPGLVWLSERKPLTFGTAAVMLLLAGTAQWRARNRPCPLDPAQARACASARRWSFIVYVASVAIFIIGSGFAFLPELFAG
jgi:hypothetical protein